MAQQVPEKISFPLEEEKVQAYWKSIDAFKTSLKQSKGKPKYVHTYTVQVETCYDRCPTCRI